MNSARRFGSLLLLSASFALPAQAQVTGTRLVLKGLVCAYCAQGLSKQLVASSEVASVDVRLKTHDAVVRFKPGRALSEAALARAAKDAGLDIERFEPISD
jgi:mercuric ion binding protein